MVVNQTANRRLRTIALVTLGVLAGIDLYCASMLALAAAGFHTLAIGTASFLTLVIWAVLTSLFAVTARHASAEFKRQLRLFFAGMLAFVLISCVAAVVFIPQLVAFWPH